MTQPDVGQRVDNLPGGQIDPEARDRLELVQRAAGMAEPAPGHHRHDDAAGRGERREDQRRLVADAARAVLVDLQPGEPPQVEPGPRMGHGLRQPGGLLVGHARAGPSP